MRCDVMERDALRRGDMLHVRVRVCVFEQTLKTIATFGEQACALQWRAQLVRFLQAMYLKDRTAYTLIMGIGGNDLKRILSLSACCFCLWQKA